MTFLRCPSFYLRQGTGGQSQSNLIAIMDLLGGGSSRIAIGAAVVRDGTASGFRCVKLKGCWQNPSACRSHAFNKQYHDSLSR